MSPSRRNMSYSIPGKLQLLTHDRFFSVPKGLKHILFFEKEVAAESLVVITVRVCTCIQIMPPPGTLFPNPSTFGETYLPVFTQEGIIFILDGSCQV